MENQLYLQFLNEIAQRAVQFFWEEIHPITGLTKDRAHNTGDPDDYNVSSIASTGYALSAFAIAAKNKWKTKQDCENKSLKTLRYLQKMHHHNGFFYHFVDWKTGERVWQSELSSIDSALLFYGAIVAGEYFKGECLKISTELVERADWKWMQNSSEASANIAPCMGWKPESGFLPHRWEGYSEALFLYILGLGTSQHPLPIDSWKSWNFPKKTMDGIELFGGASPVFWAQMTSGYLNLDNLTDNKGRDWWTNFKNSHKHNVVFCNKNKEKFKTYKEGLWGITACDQPPPVGYGAQSPKDGENDGTIAPSAILSGLIFVRPDSEKSVKILKDKFLSESYGRYGFCNALNLDKNWFDRDVIGIDTGMALLCIENLKTHFVWNLVKQNKTIKQGLTLTGFSKKKR